MTHPDNKTWTLTEKDGTEYQLVDGWLFRLRPGRSGWVPAYGYVDHKQRKEALALQQQIAEAKTTEERAENDAMYDR